MQKIASCLSLAEQPHVMVILNADDGNIITTLPLAGVTDGAVFNPEQWKHSAHMRKAR